MLKSCTRSSTIIITHNQHDFHFLTTDEQVEHGYRMAAPQGCAPALYDIMLECWHKVQPTFSTLSLSHSNFSRTQ